MESIEIIDTKKENNLIIHVSEKLPEFINEEFIAKVNVQKENLLVEIIQRHIYCIKL